MPLSPITPERIARIERFHLQFNVARMEALRALPGNPYAVTIQRFGQAVACKTNSPLLRGKNRIHNFRADDVPYLDDALAFFRRDGLRCTLGVLFGQMTPALFVRLVEAGLWSGGSGTVPCILPGRETEPETPGSRSGCVTIRRAEIEDKALYLDLFRRAFETRQEGRADYLLFQWTEDTLPGGRRYIAEIDGLPVAMASFPILGGVGYFGTAGVLPEWRGRGIQRALIDHRIADAPSLACDLIIGGGALFSTTHRNFERAGMQLVPLGSGWADRT